MRSHVMTMRQCFMIVHSTSIVLSLCFISVILSVVVPSNTTGNDVIDGNNVNISLNDLPVITRTATVWIGSEAGTLVSTMESYVGQRCEILSRGVNAIDLGHVNTGSVEDLFALLANGDLIVVGDLTSLDATPSGGNVDEVSIYFVCRLGLLVWTEITRVTLFGYRHRTPFDATPPVGGFRKPSYEGSIDENRAAGTTVENLESIGVRFGNNEMNGTFMTAVVDCSLSRDQRYYSQDGVQNGDVNEMSTTNIVNVSLNSSYKSGTEMSRPSSTQVLNEQLERTASGIISDNNNHDTLPKQNHVVICYSIVSGPTGIFRLEANKDGTISIRTLIDLDYERQSQYLLTIKAEPEVKSLETELMTTSLAHVRIFVGNVNDNTPQLDATDLHIRFDDDREITNVLPVQVTGYDIDGDELAFTIGSSNYGDAMCSKLFRIDPMSGIIQDVDKDYHLIDYFRKCRFDVFADDGKHRSEPEVVTVEYERSKQDRRSRGDRRSDEVAIATARGRRDARPLRQVEVPENMIGDLLDLDDDTSGIDGALLLSRHQHEFYAFKDPPPTQLELNALTGKIKVRHGERLDYETQPEINFVVLVTRIDDASVRDEQPVRIRLSDVNDELPVFKNVPRPFLATVSANAGPGTSVYQLMAQDADEDGVVRYILESGGEDRFEVDSVTGVVRTRGTDPFPHGKEYEIGVSAHDVSVRVVQRSPTHSLRILVGERDPQFFETQYVAGIPETETEQYRIVEVKAYSHQGFPLTYELSTDTGQQSNEFAIDPTTGVVDLLRQLDYEKDPHQYHLRVKVVENGRPARSSTVNLIINLMDMNDNSPTFPLSQYVVQGIAETVAIGTDIIQVTATDLDSVTNSQLTYSVSDHSFSVQTLNNIGYIKTARRLDFDRRSCRSYNFTIVATDNGVPPHHGSANVRVSVTNVNDEDPAFVQPIEHILVSEDAPSNTVIHVIQVYDPDGDDVTFSFAGGRLIEGPFTIDPRSGVVTLVGSLDKVRRSSYRLNITATDNGRCCGGTTSRASRGLVIVEIKDVNNNAPKFPDCSTYTPSVMENENIGTFVIQVRAVDLDTGSNGNVTYSLVKSSDQSAVVGGSLSGPSGERFEVDALSGVIRTADVFDREAQIGISTEYRVTVKAEDRGSPSLAGFCSFRVRIADRNDNPPVFNLPHYTTSVEERSPIGRRVKQIYATDRDAGDNGKIEYFIVDDPSGFFAINHYTGWLTVTRPMSGWRSVQLELEARDCGSPTSKSSRVRMDIDITQTSNSYPQWIDDYSSTVFRISESAPVNTVVARLKAVATNADSLGVNYVIQSGDTAEQNGPPRSFYQQLDERTNEMLVKTYQALDYESIPHYTLTIKAANRATNSLHNDTWLKIDVIDANDEIPLFIGLDENGRYAGSVAENLEPGAEVITVTATDRDEFPDFKKVTYRIKEAGPDSNKFSIGRQTGVIRSVVTFDCEQKKEYYITVVAEDGAKSDRPNHYPPGTPNQGEAEVQIRVTDTNDNGPYFRERVYSARVPENTEPGTVIILVTAEDRDEENKLTYSIIGGNVGGAFEVVPELGEIKVRASLDYEAGPRNYQMTYRVFDDKFANTTTLIINVLDVNDNPPKFDNAIYNVTDAQEEELGISKNNPKYLLTVRATDPDVDRNSHIRYSLMGQFADDGTFVINEHTGEVYTTRALDRDPPRGRPVWNFNVLAHDEMDGGSLGLGLAFDGRFSMIRGEFMSDGDESLSGYAEVRVIPRDINDNAPVFDRNRLIGRVPEHSRAGMTVLTVIATDADNGNNGSVTYSLKQVPMKGSQPLFSIDSHMGLITTMLTNSLDREVQATYHIIVQARDRGSPPMSASATVTILVDDVNDHAPQFVQSVYRATMSENLGKGGSVTSVLATDLDLGVNARLTYTLAERDREYFYISTVDATNTGVVKVFKPVDFDALPNPVFNLTVYVQDPDTTHVDTASVEIRVTDYNDNPPVFIPNQKKVTIFENVTVGTSLHKFSATDKDTGQNKLFTFAIERQTDPDRQFAVDGNGLVTTAKRLDREVTPSHRIHVLAIDKGTTPQTGTGTLIVNLIDVNDNHPEFAEGQQYRPIIYENLPAGRSIIELSAMDRDTLSNGPPFELFLPCSGSCPCHANPACGDFAFRYIQGGGDNGYGSGIITSLKTFDREHRKEYQLPIIIRDSGSPPMSGTNTLTIIVGDVNDNRHHPAHKDVLVYSYRGVFENAPLGNVFAEDLDDWDINNKTFTFAHKEYETLFRLDQDTGLLSMNGRLKPGDYNVNVRVYDVFWKREVVSSVSVVVKEISDDAIASAGTVRFQGLTAEEFVERPRDSREVGVVKSRYDIFRSTVSRWLDIHPDDIDIFACSNHVTSTRTIDLWYSARGNGFYFRPARLDGLVLTHRDELERLLGGRVLSSPVDECLRNERCNDPNSARAGGCSNIRKVTGEPQLVNTNSTSVVCLTTSIQASCACAAREFGDQSHEVECRADSCLNGGTCFQEEYSFTCSCLESFDGPRCQQTRLSFSGLSSDGGSSAGWAWYPGLSSCADTHTSFELMTTRDNGLVVYHGPLRDITLADANSGTGHTGELEDFLVVEMRAGYPVLRINLGTGEARLTIDGRDKTGQIRVGKLSDGRWHRVDLFITGKQIRLVIDRCEAATVIETDIDHSSTEDRRSCESVAETPGDARMLNVNGPLQLGGKSNTRTKYPNGLHRDGFNGCIKNFFHNGQLYDLHAGDVTEHRGADNGCVREDAACRLAVVTSQLTDGTVTSYRKQSQSTSKTSVAPRCGLNATCIGSFHGAYQCICRPGWRGNKCNIPTTVRDFRSRSFIEWDFQDRFYEALSRSSHRTDVQLTFRTRSNSGLLFKVQNAQKSEYIILEIAAYHLRFRYNLGSGEQSLSLSYVNVSDGGWHTVLVERVGHWSVMRLDSGDARYINETDWKSAGSVHSEIRVSQRGLLAGGDARFPSSNSPPIVDNDFDNGCITDIRYNGEWLPMDSNENRDNRVADFLQSRSQNLLTGCQSTACMSQFTTSVVCYHGLVCVDRWRHAECRCPVGRRLVSRGASLDDEVCENVNECNEAFMLCGRHGNCRDLSDGYACDCHHGYTGSDCTLAVQAKLWPLGEVSLIVGGSAAALVLVCFLLLVIVLITRRRHQKRESYAVVSNPDEDIRENIIHYDEEGVGEEDQHTYDINQLKKPLSITSTTILPCVVPSPPLPPQDGSASPRCNHCGGSCAYPDVLPSDDGNLQQQ